MFKSRISAGATEKLPGWQKPHAQRVAWSYDMEGHAEKYVGRYCELANEKVEQTARNNGTDNFVAICVEARMALQRTHDVKRKASEVQGSL